MVEIQRDGDISDRTLVSQATEQHGRFLEATGRLFDAIDRGDIAAALRIDADETDPVFGVMEATVLGAAAGKHDRALIALQELQNLESVTRVLTPVVFLAGLLLAGLLASITREHRADCPERAPGAGPLRDVVPFAVDRPRSHISTSRRWRGRQSLRLAGAGSARSRSLRPAQPDRVERGPLNRRNGFPTPR